MWITTVLIRDRDGALPVGSNALRHVEWSLDALADLNRFAAFLHDQFPELAARVSAELIARTEVLRRHPQLGGPLGHRHEYREIVLTVLGGTYARQYRYDGSSVLMLRIFDGRERR